MKRLLLCAVLATCLPAQAQTDDGVLVAPEHFACVVEHAEMYLAAPKNPVVIVLSECPNPSSLPSRGTSSTGPSNSLPPPPTDRSGEPRPSPVQNVLIISKRDLRCLKSASAKLMGAETLSGGLVSVTKALALCGR